MTKELIDKITVTSNEVTRLLFLDGEKGSIACRVYGNLIANPIPKLSPHNNIETSLRSRLRCKNLIAVRGIPGKGMVGPADYYGNWEKAENYSYSIDINNGFPTIYQHPDQETITSPLRQITNDETTEIQATWISGSDKTLIQERRKDYQNPNNQFVGDSLFANSGILEINDSDEIELKYIDAIDVDLSCFKARLVPNNEPFKITSEPIPPKDEWRAVSYHYEPGYAKYQVEHGGGLFLETHDFPQSITPLEEGCSGFVTLAKWVDDTEKDTLELIAVRIPFGYTIIFEKGCIHGDTDLEGMFMMCMTSNHVTMSSANTVFLKNVITKNNITLLLNNAPNDEPLFTYQNNEQKPLVLYRDYENYKDFQEKTRGMDFMFNPFSAGWWNHIMYEFSCISLPLLGAFVAATIALTVAALTTLGVGVIAVSAGVASLATTGFFAFRIYQECTKESDIDCVHNPAMA